MFNKLIEELIDNDNSTDVMFVDGTSLPVVATFRNKYIAVVSTRSKILLPLCTYSTVLMIVVNFKPFEFSTSLH